MCTPNPEQEKCCGKAKYHEAIHSEKYFNEIKVEPKRGWLEGISTRLNATVNRLHFLALWELAVLVAGAFIGRYTVEALTTGIAQGLWWQVVAAGWAVGLYARIVWGIVWHSIVVPAARRN